MKIKLHASLAYVHVAFLALSSATLKSSRAQKMQHTPDTHQRTVDPAAGGGGGRLDHGARVGVEEWVGRYAPCSRARAVQRIRCCNRIRKLACERASRWETAWRSSAKLEQTRLLLPSFKYWATVGATERSCVYCSTVIARNSLLIAVVLVSGWYWEHVSVWSWRTAGKAKQRLFDRLDGSFHLLAALPGSRRTSPLSAPHGSCHSEPGAIFRNVSCVLKDREVKLKKCLTCEDKVGQFWYSPANVGW